MKPSIALFAFLILCVAGAHADEWLQGASDDGSYYWAATSNANNDSLGQYCYPDTGYCYYLISMDASCEKDGKYAGLVNVKSGAYQVELSCGWKAGNKTVYLFNDFKTLDSLVNKSPIIGIAMAMDGGHFEVYRFDLSGSSDAISRMVKRAEKARVDRRQKTTPLPAKEQI